MKELVAIPDLCSELPVRELRTARETGSHEMMKIIASVPL